MSFFVRKINRAKWQEIAGDISADAVTSCLRTSQNALSFWRISEVNKNSIEEAILALATTGDRIDKIDIVIIEESFFIKQGLTIEEVEGKTLVEDLKGMHRDVIDLNFNKIRIISDHIWSVISHSMNLSAEELQNFDELNTFRPKQIIEIIRNAIKSQRLQDEILPDKIREVL